MDGVIRIQCKSGSKDIDVIQGENEMLRIAICDDEDICAQKNKKIVAEYLDRKLTTYKIDVYNSGKELIQLGSSVIKYNIIFLDINMTEIDGLETARMIRNFSDDIFIVFVAADKKYALEGYKLNVTRYLLKDNKWFSKSVYECMDAILHKMNFAAIKKEIPFNEGRREIALQNLLFIESKLHKLYFYVMEEQLRIYTLYDTLNNIESQYINYQFIRIHQSYLVNMEHISGIERYEALLSNGMRLVIPRARYKYVKEKLSENGM